jgi:hypothetical protein
MPRGLSPLHVETSPEWQSAGCCTRPHRNIFEVHVMHDLASLAVLCLAWARLRPNKVRARRGAGPGGPRRPAVGSSGAHRFRRRRSHMTVDGMAPPRRRCPRVPPALPRHQAEIHRYRDKQRTRARKGQRAPGTVAAAAAVPGSSSMPPRGQGLLPGTRSSRARAPPYWREFSERT